MTLVAWSIVPVVVSVLWALVPGRGGLPPRRLIPGLCTANIGLAILTALTIHGIAGTLMTTAFLCGAAWLLVHDVRLGRRSIT